MTHMTLALPYALPPPEMAPDLVRALDAPALSLLLSRHNSLQRTQHSPAARILPHEAWLARQLLPGAPPGSAPLAGAALHACGLAPTDGHWFMLLPAHVQLSRTHLLLADPRQLHLSDAESRTLFELARPSFEAAGQTLLYGHAGLWLLRADDWAELDTASPDAAVAQNLSDWMPEGNAARAYRRLQNEIQMLWHEHPINQQRQGRGLAAVNAFWLWAGAGAAGNAAAATARSVSIDGPAWLATLATNPAPADASQWLAQLTPGQDASAMLAGLIPSAVAGDWADWLAGLHHIEQHWCAPLLAALQAGRIDSVTLHLNHRNASLSTRSSRLALRKFWRKPTLNLLK